MKYPVEQLYAVVLRRFIYSRLNWIYIVASTDAVYQQKSAFVYFCATPHTCPLETLLIALVHD